VSRRVRKTVEDPGQDSFLDIVANLVGIMIILVMVVGAQAKVAWNDTAEAEKKQEALKKLTLEVRSIKDESLGLEHDNNRLRSKIADEKKATDLFQIERSFLLRRSQELASLLESKKNDLGKRDQERLAAQRQLLLAQEQLDAVRREHQQVVSLKAPKAVIEHLPTPIAKTVFGKEIHFRLYNGQLSYVPLDELVELMRSEWRVKAEKLHSANQTIETVGPIDNFRLQYQLALTTKSIQTEYGPVRQQQPEFIGFKLRPNRENIGRPMQEQLQPGSDFIKRVEQMDPAKTTVTVWVYPDSYSEFIQLKRWLFDRGYLTASWPLPFGQPISGGPTGYRSTAQ